MHPKIFRKYCDNPAQFTYEYKQHICDIIEGLTSETHSSLADSHMKAYKNGESRECIVKLINDDPFELKGKCRLCPLHSWVDLF